MKMEIKRKLEWQYSHQTEEIKKEETVKQDKKGDCIMINRKI